MKQKLSLITGASSGIGEALAYELAVQGSNLILIARRADRLQSVTQECLRRNPKINIETLQADVTENDFVQKLQALLNGKQLNQLYVNAGIGSAGRFEKLTVQDFRRVIETNLMGAIQTVQACLEALQSAQGRIIFLGSLNSYLALPLGTPYNISKFALRALSESLEAELAAKGISVSLACPGPVRTEILAKDNKGNPKPDAKAFFAKKPALDASVAAKRIIRGANRGRREFSLSFTGSLAIFLQRHFPCTVAWIVRKVFVRFEKKFVALVGLVNPDSV